MPDPFEPMPHNAGEPRGAGRPHLDAGTIALLADVELDQAAVSEFARFLLEDDPQLPIAWHAAGLLDAVEHLRGCAECSTARTAVLPAAAAALVIEAKPSSPARAALLDAQVAAALAAFGEPGVHVAAADPSSSASTARSSRSTRSSRWRGWFGAGNRTGGLGSSSGSMPSPGSASGASWAFARDRRVLMALAVLLAIAVPLLVGTARSHRPNASKVVTVAKTTTTLQTAESSDRERADGGSSGAGDNATDTTAAAQLAPQAAAGALSATPATDPPVSFDAQAANDTAAPTPPLPTADPAPAPSPSAAPTAVLAPATPASTPAAAKKSATAATPAPPVASASSGATSEGGVVSDAPSAHGLDLGNLGSFPDDDAAVAAFGRAGDAMTAAAPGRATAEGSAARAAPAGPAAPSAAGAAIVPTESTTIPVARPPSASVAACANALRGADRFAVVDIGGASMIIAAFGTPPPGHIQLIAVDGCVVRRDRPR